MWFFVVTGVEWPSVCLHMPTLCARSSATETLLVHPTIFFSVGVSPWNSPERLSSPHFLTSNPHWGEHPQPPPHPSPTPQPLVDWRKIFTVEICNHVGRPSLGTLSPKLIFFLVWEFWLNANTTPDTSRPAAGQYRTSSNPWSLAFIYFFLETNIEYRIYFL